MIKEVLRYPPECGLSHVAALDENGDEIPAFTGKYQEVRVKILARAPKGVKFFHSIWGLKGLEKQEVSRKEW